MCRTFPDVRNFVEPKRDPSERPLVADYLVRGTGANRMRGLSHCRCCKQHDGSAEMTDGLVRSLAPRTTVRSLLHPRINSSPTTTSASLRRCRFRTNGVTQVPPVDAYPRQRERGSLRATASSLARRQPGVRTRSAGCPADRGVLRYRLICRPALAEIVGDRRRWTVLMISLLSMPWR
jgi:hypothetical protein